MNQLQKNALDGRLGKMTAKERKQIMRRAAEMRHAEQQRTGRNAGPIEAWIRRLVEQETGLDVRSEADDRPVVVSVDGPAVRVRLADGTVVRAAFASGLRPVVGDRVVLRGGRATEIAPRRTCLSRPDPSQEGASLPMAANVDRVVVVVSVGSPPFHPRLIDRALVAIEASGADPAICLNKIDSIPEEELAEARRRLKVYEDRGVPVAAVSAESGQGLDLLRNLLVGRTSVLIGHSGVGKSSLTNALLGQDLAESGRLQKRTGRGRHTTSASRLWELPGGGWIVDTPGVRVFGEECDAREGFPEFGLFECRFRDCRHVTEPDCGVQQAVREGRLSSERYDAYRRLLATGEDLDQFACIQCGHTVVSAGAGSEHRNHCPVCLWSRHLDNQPGDRLAACGDEMEPVSVWVRKNGEWAIIHRCRTCGVLHSNRVAADDNRMLLLSIAARPLAQPAFPLDRCDPDEGSWR